MLTTSTFTLKLVYLSTKKWSYIPCSKDRACSYIAPASKVEWPRLCFDWHSAYLGFGEWQLRTYCGIAPLGSANPSEPSARIAAEPSVWEARCWSLSRLWRNSRGGTSSNFGHPERNPTRTTWLTGLCLDDIYRCWGYSAYSR